MRMFKRLRIGLGSNPFGSFEDEKQVQEIAKKYNIEYDNIKALISVIKSDYDRVIRMKKKLQRILIRLTR